VQIYINNEEKILSCEMFEPKKLKFQNIPYNVVGNKIRFNMALTKNKYGVKINSLEFLQSGSLLLKFFKWFDFTLCLNPITTPSR